MHRPPGMSAFEFVVVSSLRAAQLMRGCTARVDGAHKVIVTAQLEVAAGAIVGARTPAVRGNGKSGAAAAHDAEAVPALLALVP